MPLKYRVAFYRYSRSRLPGVPLASGWLTLTAGIARAAAWSLTISKHLTFPLAPSEFSCCRSRDLRLGVIFQSYADFHESPGKFSRDDNFFHRYWSRRWHGRIIWTTILQRPVLASRRGICPSLPTLPLINKKSDK